MSSLKEDSAGLRSRTFKGLGQDWIPQKIWSWKSQISSLAMKGWILDSNHEKAELLNFNYSSEIMDVRLIPY